MKGVRVLPDLIWGNDPREGFRLQPGEYVKIINGPTPWMANDPNDGGPFVLGVKNHAVHEHPDGTITVTPSIYDTSPGGWHGWLRQGVWESC